jgi:glycosyltransferase involved in cell wall biosynthesis
MPSELSILQVSTADVLGGAESIARNLHLGYCRLGHDSHMAVGRKRSDDSDVHRITHHQGKSRSPLRRVLWGLHAAMQPHFEKIPGARFIAPILQSLAEPSGWHDRRRGIEDFHFPGSHRLLDLPPRTPNLVHCHNLHANYFDLRALPALCRRVPVILTLHDAWLLAGHCAHSFDCDRWRTGCGHCPDLSIYPAVRRDATAENWRRKAEVFAQCTVCVTAPCNWLLDRAKQSMLAPAIADARVIPNGVDTSIFRPGDMQAARRALGLPMDAAILLFVAQSPGRNPFKDFATLRRAINRLAAQSLDRPLLFVALGGDGQTEQMQGAEIRYIPAQNDPATVASYYRAADLYIHAARADTFPNTILEALACGRPVVATAVGGIPEQVISLELSGAATKGGPIDDATGVLVAAGDADGLAHFSAKILGNRHLAIRLAGSAAKDAASRFSLDRQVEAFLALYRELLDPHSSHPPPVLMPRAEMVSAHS